MLTEDRFCDILKKLLEKSRKDQVAWEAAADGGYSVAFAPNAAIHIDLITPKAALDNAGAEFVINGRAVLTVLAEDGDETFALLRDLYNEADRTFVGWDETLREIEQVLDSDRPVGTPATVPDDGGF